VGWGKMPHMPTRKKNQVPGRLPSLKIRRVLVPTDFSPASGKALEYAFHFARLCDSEVTLLHVVDSPDGLIGEPQAVSPSTKGFEKSATENLNALIRASRFRRIAEAKPLLRRGVPTHEIVEAAKELDVDLIVIATHGFTGWRHFAIGSTAERVARAAPCPVLVVREKEHEFI
jgi:universal stress protein A